MLSSVRYPWPLVVRFRLSRSAFERAVVDYRAGRFTAGQWVGLYYVQAVEQVVDSLGASKIWFETGDSFGDPVGFEYDPNPIPKGTSYGYPVAQCWYPYEH